MSPLLRPGFLAAHVVVLAIAVLFISLGLWQLRRAAEVRAENAEIAALLDDDPVPLEAALDDGARELQLVTTGGTWREGTDISLTPRSRGGLPGYDVLTVLDREEGDPVLVDRGWVALDAEVPPAPAGRVEVTGRLRAAQQERQVLRDDAGRVTAIRAVSPEVLLDRAPDLRTDVWVELVDDRASAANAVPRPATSDVVLDDGNHLSYAFQWFSFTVIGLVGYPLLLRRRLSALASPAP